MIDHHYAGGEWIPSSGTGTIDVLDPSSEQVIATVAAGTSDDVDHAVRAARGAFPAWAETQPDERAEWLRLISGALEAAATRSRRP